MTWNAKKLKDQLKTHLENDPVLSFNQAVEICQYHPENLPEMEDYCILISTRNWTRKMIANRTRKKKVGLDIVVIVRNFDAQLSIDGEPPDDPGLEYFVQKVEESIFAFLEAQRINISLTFEEMDGSINFKNHPYPEHQGFFHEVIIPLDVDFKPYTI